MNKRMIEIGDAIMYRGSFGYVAIPIRAVIIGIAKSKQVRDRYGDKVDRVLFRDRQFACFDLDNGNWCYGDQIDRIISV